VSPLVLPPTQLTPLEQGRGDGVGRLARRTQRGQGRRRLLVAGLIALSVLLGVGSAVLAATMARSDATVGVQDRFGTAAALVSGPDGVYAVEQPSDPSRADLTPEQLAWLGRHALDGDLPSATGPQDLPLEVLQAIGYEPVTVAPQDVLAGMDLSAGDVLVARSVQTYDQTNQQQRVLTDLDVTHPLAGTTYDAGGRTEPLAGREGLLSPSLLAALGGEVGQMIEVPGIGPVDVVGTATRSFVRSQQLAVVAPGRAFSPRDGFRQADLRFADAADARRYVERLEERGQELAAALPTPSRDDLAAVGIPPGEQLPPPYVAGNVVEERSDYLSYAVAEESLATIVGGTVTALATVVAAVVGACAFAVGVRRRIREIGTIGAIGATPAQLRRLLRREGLVIGLGGAMVGAVAGLVLAFAAQPLAERVVDRDLQVAVPVVGALLPVVVGGLGAFLAAVWPARTAARVPTTTALAGRVPLGRVPGWLPVAGAVAAAAGVALLAELVVGSTTGTGLDAVQLLGAVLLATLGTAALGIPVIAAGGLLADRLPLLGRLALRDAARQRTRSAAAVAALVPVLAIPVAAGTVVFSEQVQFAGQYGGMVAEDGTPLEALPYADPGGSTLAIVDGAYLEGRQTPPSQATIAAVAAELPDVAGSAPLVHLGARDLQGGAVAVLPYTDDGRIDPVEADVSSIGRLGWAWGDRLALATPELLGLLGLPADAVPADGALVLDGAGASVLPDDLSSLQVVQVERPDEDGRRGQRILGEVVVGRTDAVSGGISPGVLVGPDTADRLGLVETARPQLLRLEAVPSAAQATAAYASVDGTIGAGAFISTAPPFWATSLGIAVLIALAVVAAALGVSVVAGMTSALAATESDGDLRKAVALGAEPSLRRRLHGLQAWWHTVIAAVLGAGLGLAVAWAVVRGTTVGAGYVDDGQVLEQVRATIAVHWLGLAAWVVVVPVLVGLVIAAVMRSSPVTAPRRRMA